MDDKTTDNFLTKQILRSILISYPNGINTNQLSKEFYDREGKHIPYFEFGYNSLIEFLESNPDVFRIHGSPYDSRNASIYPVVDEFTCLISPMVCRQKCHEPNNCYKPSNLHSKYAERKRQLDARKLMIIKNREIMISNIEMILRENSMPWFNAADLPHLYCNRFNECLPPNWIESIRDRFDFTFAPATNGDITLIALKLDRNSSLACIFNGNQFER